VAAIEEREQKQVRTGHEGDALRPDDLERAGQVLQKLEQREKVPFGARGIIARGSAGRIERRAMFAVNEHHENGEHDQRGREILQHLPREELVDHASIGVGRLVTPCLRKGPNDA